MARFAPEEVQQPRPAREREQWKNPRTPRPAALLIEPGR
jgi:hypothetical protein